ncbi:MAG: hypothetical protein ACW99A_09650 [Candidatus Kariarchaeaceae archaeon]|jgi:hypothetical protein
MASKILTVVQAVFILLTGLLVFEFGYSFYHSDGDDFGITEAIFSDDPSEWWNTIVFWGYSFLVVGVVQLVKALSSD